MSSFLYNFGIFFNSFALNMVLQYRQTWRWRNYLFGENEYILLSLTAKSLLAWQVFAGTLTSDQISNSGSLSTSVRSLILSSEYPPMRIKLHGTRKINHTDPIKPLSTSLIHKKHHPGQRLVSPLLYDWIISLSTMPNPCVMFINPHN